MEQYLNTQKYHYHLSLPTLWKMDEAHPNVVEKFNQVALKNGTTMYQAFAEEAKCRVQHFLDSEGIQGRVCLKFYDPMSISLFFSTEDHIPKLKKSLKTIFADLPLSEEAIRTNVGAQISVNYEAPHHPDDPTWDWY
jgi:hypothetical protein